MTEPHPQLRTGPDGRLQCQSAEAWIPVRAVRCFPWISADRHFSLRDRDGKEVALVDDPTDLDGGSRQALQLAVAASASCLEICKIRRIVQDIELRVWEVETKAGARKFQTELDSWPELIPGGGSIVRDITGDLYRIPRPEELDQASKKLLWAFLD